MCMRLTWERAGALPQRSSRQGQGATHPHVVERLSLVVDPGPQGAVPVALLHHDLVAKFLLQLVYRRRRVAAKLGRRAVGADRIELHRLLRRVDPDEAVKIGQPLMVVMGVALSFDLLARLESGEDERAQTP